METTGRGVLTPKLEEIGLTQDEIRLIPYVHYCNINYMRIDIEKITRKEMDIIDKWVEEGRISNDVFDKKFSVTREFWDLMNEVLWEAYANK